MDSDSKQNRKRIHPIWYLLLLAMMIWNVIEFWPEKQTEAKLTYSAFLGLVEQGQVASVTIQEGGIRGEFAAPTSIPASDLSSARGSQDPSAAPTTPTDATTQFTEFRTYTPAGVGDPGLLPVLRDHNVAINAHPAPTPWLAVLLTNGLPLLLLIGLMVWMQRQAGQSQRGLFSFGQSRAHRYQEQMEEVTFDDVAGAEEAKQDLQEVVDFLRNPNKYFDLGARIPRGVLLAGPPGTGKTLMARAVAGEADVPFFSLSASEFVEMFVGVGASRVRDLFERALAAAPSIVFIDELDAVGRRRGAGLGAVNDEREQTLNQLLVEMDGFDEHHELILMAATNRPDVLDPALLRPGRFDRRIVFNLPDRRGREGILRIHTSELPLADDVEFDPLARTTTGFSGADLANLCNESALIAARHEHVSVTMADFEEALDKVLLGGVRPLLLDAHERRVIAYHEAGHTVVAWFTPLADPVHKITIIPHGKALGVTEQLPRDDHYNYSRGYLLARLAVVLGGRAAEELALKDITTGAENDLREASRLARRMVTRWGMGSLDVMAFAEDEQAPFLGYELTQSRKYSEQMAAHIDQDTQDLLTERHQYARNLLKERRQELDQLVELLLKKETLERSEIERVLGEQASEIDPAPELVG